MKDLHSDGHFYSVKGIKLHYTENGRGKPILLLHGLGGCSYDWRGCVDLLAGAGFRVLALDIKGAGLSDKPEKSNYSIKQIADEIRSFVKGKGIGKTIFIGNSFGGVLSLQIAMDDPELIGALVLIDTICYKQDLPYYFDLFSIPWLPEQIIHILPTRTILVKVLKSCYANPDLLKEEEIDQYLLEINREGRREALIETVRQLVPDNSEDFTNKIAKINIPTLIIWGDKDTAIPIEHAKKLNSEIKGSRLEIVANCGHTPNQEKPQEVCILITDFLNRLYK